MLHRMLYHYMSNSIGKDRSAAEPVRRSRISVSLDRLKFFSTFLSGPLDGRSQTCDERLTTLVIHRYREIYMYQIDEAPKLFAIFEGGADEYYEGAVRDEEQAEEYAERHGLAILSVDYLPAPQRFIPRRYRYHQ